MDKERHRDLERIIVEGQRLRDFAEATGYAVIAGLLGEVLEEARAQLRPADAEKSPNLGATSVSRIEGAETGVEATAEVETPNDARPKWAVLSNALWVLLSFIIGLVGVVGGLSLLQGTGLRIPH